MSYYGRANLIATGTNADIDTLEEDVVVVTETENLVDSQLNIYYDITLGTHTSMEFRYYVRFAPDGDWYELPYRNDGTGAITSVPTQATSSTPTKFVDSLPLPACVAFKITADGTGGLNGTVTATIMSRDN